MKKIKLITVFVIFGTMVLIMSNPAIAGKVTLKVQASLSTALPVLGSGLPWASNKINEVSDGQLVLKVYEPGKLVKPFEILDAVSRGFVDGGVAPSGFWAGKLPAAPIFSAIPFGPEADEFMAWLYHGNGLKLDQEMYDEAGYNVKVIPLLMMTPETSGWYSKPINSVDDLKGLKIRFYGYGGTVMQKLGASVSMMPGSELFPALEKHVLDATEFSNPVIDQRLGFYKMDGKMPSLCQYYQSPWKFSCRTN